ncbi:hypothetical protein D3C78_1812200 [compost metagenome]
MNDLRKHVAPVDPALGLSLDLAAMHREREVDRLLVVHQAHAHVPARGGRLDHVRVRALIALNGQRALHLDGGRGRHEPIQEP